MRQQPICWVLEIFLKVAWLRQLMDPEGWINLGFSEYLGVWFSSDMSRDRDQRYLLGETH